MARVVWEARRTIRLTFTQTFEEQDVTIQRCSGYNLCRAVTLPRPAETDCHQLLVFLDRIPFFRSEKKACDHSKTIMPPKALEQTPAQGPHSVYRVLRPNDQQPKASTVTDRLKTEIPPVHGWRAETHREHPPDAE